MKNGALGEISPNTPPISGPKMKPSPKAAPIKPKFFAFFFFSDDISARYAVAVGIVEPVIPAMSFPTNNIHIALDSPRIK